MNPVWHFLNGVPQIGPLSISYTAVTSTVPVRIPDGALGSSGLQFTSDGDSGLLWLANNRWGLTAASLVVAEINGGAAGIAAANGYPFSMSAALGNSSDLFFHREAANNAFQRNSTNAQRASWANTYTSATNYEAFSVDWQTVANVGLVGTRTAATGTARPLYLVAQLASGVNEYTQLRLSSAAPFVNVLYGQTNGTQVATTATGNLFQLANFTSSTTSGSVGMVAITPTYNQTSGTAANTDLLINRTETAVGSGAQQLIAAQVGGTNKFSVSNGGFLWQTRTESAESTDGNVTYTTTQVLGGIITRSNMSSNRVDAFPTAANLVAAIPGCAVGTSFDVIVNNNDTAQTVTVNGASTGITYEGAATAIAATECRLFRVLITNVTGSSEAATVFQVV